MSSHPSHHPKCPRCKGQGFYLRSEGRGYYRDGSFGHNQWADCTCSPYTPEDKLPQPYISGQS